MSLTKKQMDALENVFSVEITGGMLQSKAKVYKWLEDEGYIVMDEDELGSDRFGTVVVRGYRTTLHGHFTYCTSERCAEAVE